MSMHSSHILLMYSRLCECLCRIVILREFSHFSHYILIINELYESYYVQCTYWNPHLYVHVCDMWNRVRITRIKIKKSQASAFIHSNCVVIFFSFFLFCFFLFVCFTISTSKGASGTRLVMWLTLTNWRSS